MNYPKLRDVMRIVNGSTVVSVVVLSADDDGEIQQTRVWRGFPEYVSIDKLENMGAVYVRSMFVAGGLVLQCQKEGE